jgi:hypothetical protein
MDSAPTSRLGSAERDAIRRWAENRQAASIAEARELASSRETPSGSFGIALSLLAFYASVHGWPPPADLIDERDNRAVRGRFAKLRARLHP